MLAFSDISVAIVAALVTSAVALWWLTKESVKTARRPTPDTEPLALLFDDGVLHHATQRALTLFSLSTGADFWDDLRNTLIGRFPDFPEHPCDGEAGQLALKSHDHDSPQEAQIRWRNNLCWVTLSDTAPQAQLVPNRELDGLRRTNKTDPHPAWEEDASGTVQWYNPAYAALFHKVHGHEVGQHKSLFTNSDPDRPMRVQVSTSQTDLQEWFEVKSTATENITIFHAFSISALVTAEETQRNFVQTLTKTFAHLSIGLAIFDRNKQLSLFNPALVDLTELPAQFLSARPDMLSFFDQLREKRKMPEPKNYRNWREEIADVITTASDGIYQETWSLETGQTYSVQGRPHPDGATAFLIEDVSAEMTLTRNFRAELEQAQIVLDAVDDAIAMFSPAGLMTFSNAAYQKLWQISPDTTFVDMNMQDNVAIWKEKVRSGADIHAIGRLLSELGARDPQNVTLHLQDGLIFECQMTPILTGATLIRFRAKQSDPLKVVNQPSQTA